MNQSFSKTELKALFDGRMVSAILPYEDLEAELSSKIIKEGNGRLSISGAQEKYAVVEDQGILRLTQPDESGRYIIKPIPTDRRFFLKRDMPANENLTMTLAKEVFSLDVAAHGLCYLGNGDPVYITRRFDYKPDGSKYAMEDFASLAGLSEERNGHDFKYQMLSYEDCAHLIRQYCAASQVETMKFFRLVLFNYFFCNADAHLKNFSLMEDREGEYRLAPAYDLLNTSIHMDTPIFALDKGLFKEGTPITDTTPIGRPMFLKFGERIQLPDRMALHILDVFCQNHDEVKRRIGESSLSEEAKKHYFQDYSYRRSTLIE